MLIPVSQPFNTISKKMLFERAHVAVQKCFCVCVPVKKSLDFVALLEPPDFTPVVLPCGLGSGVAWLVLAIPRFWC